MNPRVIVAVCFIAAACLPLATRAEVSAYLGPKGTRAVDAKGIQHNGNDYPGKHPPWLDDRVKAVAPHYPFWERAKHHQGVGWFKLSLNLTTGAVAQIDIAKSTGFSVLDQSAISALRQWRWKPGKWKEIYMPVTFEINPIPSRLPPGSAPLPRT